MRRKAGGKAFGLLCVPVVANLAVLAYFKYAGFLLATANSLLGAGARMDAIVLPLGISIFTFTQIAYLVDVYREPVRYRVVPYALFVSYLPHLIAGPILHHREVMPQFASARSYRLTVPISPRVLRSLPSACSRRQSLPTASPPHASPVFEHAARGYPPGSLEAWGAALGFGLQLYFDFSAYSDMAVGLSKMLGREL